MNKESYDVIVVGAGHAGNEAAAAAARMGVSTLLITMNMQTVGQMSCNPAVGGIAKGQIVREIDALGGLTGKVTDYSTVQFRMLNRSKGPAMWSPRAQCDRTMFSSNWRYRLEQIDNLDIFQDMVIDILLDSNGAVKGVVTGLNQRFFCKTLILTSGTFLNGTIHVGRQKLGGGRMGESSARGITESLIKFGFDSGRMKTGTPPRIDGRSLDYSKFEPQEGDDNPAQFSYYEKRELNNQLNCYIAYTSDEVHETLKEGFSDSPMFSGDILGTGPRYCPSIEDKINRFAERNRHQLFIEPEGWNTNEIYLNGFSSSLPAEIQYKALKKIAGFENVKFYRPGYAIEYDYFPPTQLTHSLETKLVEGLFFAGQINGTTGYEEAACQGLMAGINAARKVREQSAVELSRSEAYIAVLIDDLITKGTEEPYRMFTSRAEHRLNLRQDNADFRLTELGRSLGLITSEEYTTYQSRKNIVAEIVKDFQNISVEPKSINPLLIEKGSSLINQKLKAHQILARPQIEIEDFKHQLGFLEKEYFQHLEAFRYELESASIEIKYSGYIMKEEEQVNKLNRLQNLIIPNNFDFKKIKSLSAEAIEKLSKIQPTSIAQASRISGIKPSDISIILVHLGR